MTTPKPELDYQTAVSEIPNILGGFGRDYVLATLGEPDDKLPDRWHYDLKKLPGYPTIGLDTKTVPWSLVDVVFDRDGRVLNIVTK